VTDFLVSFHLNMAKSKRNNKILLNNQKRTFIRSDRQQTKFLLFDTDDGNRRSNNLIAEQFLSQFCDALQ